MLCYFYQLKTHCPTVEIYDIIIIIIMRVVGLLSGGKDSCYALMQCVAAGHEVVALATLLPPEGIEENDSHMYQSVGVRGVHTIATAMGGIPLFTCTVSGSALNTSAHYSQPLPQDEVEDLYCLLQDVKAGVAGGVEGVSVGAILSDYQRVRVEHVCGRLGLVSLSYLWRREQQPLLEEMVSCGVEAVIVKVAGAGLVPSKHCGKTLEQMLPTLRAMHSKFDLHVCGEGGEFESFTLDCPLFEKRIVIVEQELIEEPGDVGYLVLQKLELVDKEDKADCQRSLYQRVMAAGVPPPSHYCRDVTEEDVSEHKGVKETTRLDACPNMEADIYKSTGPVVCIADSETTTALPEHGLTTSKDGWWSAWGWQGDCVQTLLGELEVELLRSGLLLSSAVEVRAFVKSLARYDTFNAAYKTRFGYNPPVRACIETDLQHECQLEVSGHQFPNVPPRHVMHVQSVSHWAPANIGPYSQAVKLGPVVAVAGMIGLEAGSMMMVEGGAVAEGRLALRHLTRVVEAVTGAAQGQGLAMLMQVVCYCTSVSACRAVLPLLRDLPCSVLPVVVTALPRRACVELHAWAHRNSGEEAVTEMTSVTSRGRLVFHRHLQRPDGTAAHCAVQGFSCQDEEAVSSDDVIDFINVAIERIIGNWADRPPNKILIDLSKVGQSNEIIIDTVKGAVLTHISKSSNQNSTSTTTSSTNEILISNLSKSTIPREQTQKPICQSSLPSSTSQDGHPRKEDEQAQPPSSGLLTFTVFYNASLVPPPLMLSALAAVRALFSSSSATLSITAVPVTAVVSDGFPLLTGTTSALALTATKCHTLP